MLIFPQVPSDRDEIDTLLASDSKPTAERIEQVTALLSRGRMRQPDERSIKVDIWVLGQFDGARDFRTRATKYELTTATSNTRTVRATSPEMCSR